MYILLYVNIPGELVGLWMEPILCSELMCLSACLSMLNMPNIIPAFTFTLLIFTSPCCGGLLTI